MKKTFTISDSALSASIVALVESGNAVTFAKKSLVAIAENNTSLPLLYSTILKGGHVEVKEATCPCGDAISVQPDGEVMLLKAAKVPSLYDTANPFSREAAVTLAEENKLAIPTAENIISAHAMLRSKNPSLDSDLEFSYFRAKGRIAAFRVALSIPKPSWGPGATQEAELSHLLVYNLVVKGGGYMIGKDEFLANWQAESDLTLEGKALWDSVPAISYEDFTSSLAQAEAVSAAA